MSLRETASTLAPKQTGFPCGVTKVSAQLNDDDRAWLLEALGSDAANSWISDVLKKEGWQVSQAIIARHRRKACRCEP